MTNNGTHAPPGPKGLPILGLAFEVRSDPLGTLQRLARQYGDIVSMPVMRMSRVLVNRPTTSSNSSSSITPNCTKAR
jgi:hypothetical protein